MHLYMIPALFISSTTASRTLSSYTRKLLHVCSPVFLVKLAYFPRRKCNKPVKMVKKAYGSIILTLYSVTMTVFWQSVNSLMSGYRWHEVPWHSRQLSSDGFLSTLYEHSYVLLCSFSLISHWYAMHMLPEMDVHFCFAGAQIN